MPIFENIEGPKLRQLFDRLVDDKTLVAVSVPGIKYESLTLVTGTDTSGSRQVFHIDPPEGLMDHLKTSNPRRMHFEFTSEDGVTHSFDSEINSTSNKAVTLSFPDAIQRHQQRDNFRVKTVFESTAQVVIDQTKIRMVIENISLGGIYCYCLNKHKALFAERQTVRDLELLITQQNECFTVYISRARVNRIETSRRPRHFGVAFEFNKVSPDARKVLVQQIYELQRHILQNRLKSEP